MPFSNYEPHWISKTTAFYLLDTTLKCCHYAPDRIIPFPLACLKKEERETHTQHFPRTCGTVYAV